jgi:hypothetical protein
MSPYSRKQEKNVLLSAAQIMRLPLWNWNAAIHSIHVFEAAL